MSSGQSYRVVFAGIARTATPTASSFSDITQRRLGGHFVLDVTAIGAAPSVVFNFEAFDPLSTKWYTILTSAAIVAVGTTVLRIYPGVTPAANTAVSDVLPPTWRVRPVHGNSDSITYTLSALLFD